MRRLVAMLLIMTGTLLWRPFDGKTIRCNAFYNDKWLFAVALLVVARLFCYGDFYNGGALCCNDDYNRKVALCCGAPFNGEVGVGCVPLCLLAFLCAEGFFY